MDDALGPPNSKSDYVLQRLRTEILDGSLNPGAPLRQSDLADRYGVSPTPVREALRLLESEGLVIYAPHRGATVADYDENRLNDIYLIRAELEGLGAELAAQRMTPESLKRIEEAHAELTEAHREDRIRELPALNKQFHFAIYEAASPALPPLIGGLWASLPPAVTLWVKGHDFREGLLEEHGQIVEAIRAGAPTKARKAMSHHMKNALQHRSEMPAFQG